MVGGLCGRRPSRTGPAMPAPRRRSGATGELVDAVEDGLADLARRLAVPDLLELVGSPVRATATQDLGDPQVVVVLDREDDLVAPLARPRRRLVARQLILCLVLACLLFVFNVNLPGGRVEVRPAATGPRPRPLRR